MGTGSEEDFGGMDGWLAKFIEILTWAMLLSLVLVNCISLCFP